MRRIVLGWGYEDGVAERRNMGGWLGRRSVLEVREQAAQGGT